MKVTACAIQSLFNITWQDDYIFFEDTVYPGAAMLFWKLQFNYKTAIVVVCAHGCCVYCCLFIYLIALRNNCTQ